jgi:predicted amidophosphoribosyltransferase
VLLSDRCRTTLPIIDRAHACPRCGAPDGRAGCPECERLSFGFASARCAGVFEWPLSRAVTLHKDAAELRLTPFLARLASDAAGEWREWAQAVVCVPASPGAYARRGFDHGALLGAAFAHITGVPAIDVLRALPRRDQRLLTRERRRANAGASLVAVPGAFVPARVLVLDDVMTTGATMESAAVALLEAGVAEVRAVAVARACSGRT